MVQHTRTWLRFHDVDEYYVINSDLVNGAHEKMSQPGSALKFVQEIQGILEHLHDLSKHIQISYRYVGPCVTTFRTLYGADESTEEKRRKDVPSFLDARSFDTSPNRPKASAGKIATRLDASTMRMTKRAFYWLLVSIPVSFGLREKSLDKNSAMIPLEL
jgi:hypothetical protein